MVRNPISISSVRDKNILSILFLVTNQSIKLLSISIELSDDTLQHKT